MNIRAYFKFWKESWKYKTSLAVERYKSVYNIPYETLARKGVKLLIFDVDDTLTAYHDRVEEKTRTLLKELTKSFHVALLSNCTAKRREEIQQMLPDVNVYISQENDKPAPHSFRSIIEHFKAAGENTAMIGDRLIVDLWGALQGGINHRFLIEPYSFYYGGEKAPVFIIFLRALEKKLFLRTKLRLNF